MPLPVDDPGTARRAIALALGEDLDRASVLRAVQVWQSDFEGRVSLFVGLTRYCRRLAQDFGLRGKEAELHLKIFRAMRTSPEHLPADPLAAPAPGAAATDGQQPGAVVVQAFVETLERQLLRDLPIGSVQWRDRLMRHLLGLPPALRPAALSWCTGSAPLHGEWPAGGAGTQLLNLAYVACTELLGPVRADRLFTHTVEQLRDSGQPTLATVRDYL